MVATFDQLVGATGDVMELEYISALHQTDIHELRRDGSIKAEDIQMFLSSRYGIAVTEEDVRNAILNGLAGGSQEDDDVLDLMELVAILLIPTLLKSAISDITDDDNNDKDIPVLDPEKATTHSTTALPEGVVPTPPGMLNYVLKMILHDVTGNSQPKALSTDLIRRILIAYGEIELAEDEALLQEMLEAANGVAAAAEENALQVEMARTSKNVSEKLDITEPVEEADMMMANETEEVDDVKQDIEAGVGTNETEEADDFKEEAPVKHTELDTRAFAEALTYDLRLYDIENEIRVSTNMEDVFVTDDNNAGEKEEKHATGESELLKGHEGLEQFRKSRKSLPISQPLVRKRTFPSIDLTAETYRSKALIVILYATILVTYCAYFFNIKRGFGTKCTGDKAFVYGYEEPWPENKDAMGCEAGRSIVSWLEEFYNMCLVGIIYVSLGSIGNHVECKQFWKPLIGWIFALCLVWVPFLSLRRGESDEHWLLYIISLLLGNVVAAMHLSHAFALLVSPETMENLESHFPKIYTMVSGAVFAETNVKQSSARKLAMMTKNAFEIVKEKDQDSLLHTHFGQAMSNYARKGKKFVKAGGFRWALQQNTSREFSYDGIWLPARMIASNIAQYVVVLYTLIGGIFWTKSVSNSLDSEWTKEKFRDYADRAIDRKVDQVVSDGLIANTSTLVAEYLSTLGSNGAEYGCTNSSASAEEILDNYCSSKIAFDSFNASDSTLTCDPDAPVNYICPFLDPTEVGNLDSASQQALLAGSGFDQNLLRQLTKEAVQDVANESVDSLYPSEKYMVMIPMVIATIFAFITVTYLALVYVPTVATTFLKLRCGAIPTLRDKDFHRYRVAPDQVALITGSIFWGTLFSGVVVGGLVGLLIFLTLWQATAYYASRFFAIIIGIIVVNIFRISLVCICRCTMYRSFYRSRPAVANLSILALEWANFSLSVGFVFVRLVKLLLAAGMSIGRIETPFLAPGIGFIGPLQLDNYPTVHLKDLLSHEAHRHPYIDQLGTIYLMKLRYAGSFGKRAGSAWRLIFVYALMPWLHKYRVLARPEAQKSLFLATDPENQYPSLRFVSLRNGFIAEDDKEDAELSVAESNDNDSPGAKLMNKSPDARTRERMLELELENKLLKEELAGLKSIRNSEAVTAIADNSMNTTDV